MTPQCPNQLCPFVGSKNFVKKDGHFFRKSESRFIQRFKCQKCSKKFSHATGTMEFGFKKRRIHAPLKRFLSSGMSMRRCALLLGVHRTTIERKLVYLAKKAELSQTKFLESIQGKVLCLQIDDLITIEHTKLKPLSVSLAVDVSTRKILGAEVSRIGAFGHLAKMSRKKYGKRPNELNKKLDHLFKTIRNCIHPKATIRSDEHAFYPPLVKKHFPERVHETFLSERSSIVGQGELKRVKWDPLFGINHTCAMLRANVNRLIRKTWCTTKNPEMLKRHLQIYIDFHNQEYLEQK
jgi:transposase-like protein